MITIIFISIIILYLTSIGCLIYGFDKVEETKVLDLKPKTKFTIIIPFRNEAQNLPHLIASIQKLSYPKNLYEIILVDDHSEDESLKIIDTKLIKNKSKVTTNIRIIQNQKVSNSPKKDAITTAIAIANFEWIITTDADCVLPKYWLETYDEFIQTENPQCIAAPVAYLNNNSFFKRFQALDFMSLQGASIGGFGINQPFLCNGANFAYRKSTFNTIKGFEGNTKIASGDDIFLLEKFKKYDTSKVKYLKSQNAIVYTNPVSNLKQLISQRLRWASKTSHNPNLVSKLLGLVIIFGNLVCITLIPALVFGYITLKIAVALLVIKFSIDFLLLFKTSRFLNQENVLLSFIPSSLLYPFFSIYIVTLSLVKSYNWKGRTFRR